MTQVRISAKETFFPFYLWLPWDLAFGRYSRSCNDVINIFGSILSNKRTNSPKKFHGFLTWHVCWLCQSLESHQWSFSAIFRCPLRNYTGGNIYKLSPDSNQNPLGWFFYIMTIKNYLLDSFIKSKKNKKRHKKGTKKSNFNSHSWGFHSFRILLRCRLVILTALVALSDGYTEIAFLIKLQLRIRADAGTGIYIIFGDWIVWNGIHILWVK